MDSNEFSNKKKLGRGTYGKVFVAEYQSKTVFLKQMLLKQNDISQEFLNFFQSECESLMNLKSPYIVAVLGYYIKPKPTIVLEYIPEGSLIKIIKEKKKVFSWTEKMKISQHIANGLNFLHNQNIIHSDLRTDNIMIDDQVNAKICDFGLIKSREYIRSLLLIGNNYAEISTRSLNAWKAPELFDIGSNFSMSSDIYSMGMTFWELYSSKTPFSNVSNKIIPNFVKNGEREEIGVDCYFQYAKLIKACWENQSKRINLDEILERFDIILQGVGKMM